MEAFALAAAAGTLAVNCGKITCRLKTFVDDVKNVEVTVASFRTEVSSLEGILMTIDSTFRSYAHTATNAMTLLESLIGQSLDHCRDTLERLDSELDKIEKKGTGSQNIWKKSYSTMRLNMSADTIKTLRSQTQIHIGALQMSFSCISV